MSTYLNFFYWFNSRPVPLTKTGQYILFAIALLCILIFIAVITKSYKRLFHIPKIASSSILWLTALSFFISLLLWFFNYELIPVLRSRFWYLLWAIGAIWWIVETIRLAIRNRRSAPVHDEREQEIKKYLPR